MMAVKQLDSETIPQPVQDGSGTVPVLEFGPPRKVLKAGPRAVAAWDREKRAQEEVNRLQAEESAALARSVVQRGLAETERLATARGEKVSTTKAGGLSVDSRDGLMWLLKKAKIHPSHYDAGLKFRGDWETANGTGVKSCLAERSGGKGAGPTDAMLQARDRVHAALDALGSPMLHPYVIHVAAESEMPTGERFCKDRREGPAHIHACALAFDILARHYGMIR